MIDKKEYVISCLEEYKAQHNITQFSCEDVVGFGIEMLDITITHDATYLGFASYLASRYGALLQQFCEKSKNHNGKKLSDIPEMKELIDRIQHFEDFCKTELGFLYKDGGFEEYGNK